MLVPPVLKLHQKLKIKLIIKMSMETVARVMKNSDYLQSPLRLSCFGFHDILPRYQRHLNQKNEICSVRYVQKLGILGKNKMPNDEWAMSKELMYCFSLIKVWLRTILICNMKKIGDLLRNDSGTLSQITNFKSFYVPIVWHCISIYKIDA